MSTEPQTTHSRRQRFESLLKPILNGAYGTAFHMTRDREEAADLVQEASVLAFRAFDRFEENTNFKAWFYRIMINRYRNVLRSRKRQPEISTLEDAPELYLYTQTARSGLHKGTQDPAGQVIGKLSQEQIRAALDALPEDFQEVALLYFLEELSYEEIAEIVDIPIGTVRSRLHRGRKLLQKALWEMAVDQGIVSPAEGG